MGKPDCVELLGAALPVVMNAHCRDGTRRILELFDELPPSVATWSNLHLFVITLCKQRGHHSAGYRFLSEELLQNYYVQIRDDFTLFLRLGNFSKELLRKALKSASKFKSSVAVEVLVSHPYCVEHDPEDAFVPHLLEAVLAPGEQETVDAGKRFAK